LVHIDSNDQIINLFSTLHFQVGRIIGKGGQNVRELQRVTGSIIKLPEHSATASPSVDEETTVHIIGPFFSVQSAQRRIRTMITVTNPPPVSGRPKPSSSSGTTTPQQQPIAPSTPKSNQSSAA
jgi:insulin-like growth factor 2 mRNA-binding protein 1